MMSGNPSDIFFFDVESGRSSQQVPQGPDASAVKAWLHTVSADLDWSDMIGNADAVSKVRFAIEAASADPEMYKAYGVTPSKGIMLYGPPGNGKTMLARIAAAMTAKRYQTAEAQCLIVNGPEIDSKYWGETEKRIRDIFAYAEAYGKHYGHPLTIFFDEADSLFRPRGSATVFHDSQVAQLLSCLQGVTTQAAGAFVVLATNRAHMIDEAILRPGRIDTKIKVGRPTLKDIEEHMLRGYRTSPMRCSEDFMPKLAAYMVDPQHVLQQIPMYKGDDEIKRIDLTFAHIISGAVCAEVFARAKRMCFERDLKAGLTRIEGIFFEDLTAAIDELVAENRGLPHYSAVAEIAEQLNLQEKRKGMN